MQHDDRSSSGHSRPLRPLRPSASPRQQQAGGEHSANRAAASRSSSRPPAGAMPTPQSEPRQSSYTPPPEGVITIGTDAAVRALFAARPHCIHKLWLSHDARKDYGEICQYLASNKKSYALVNDREMLSTFGSESHEGVLAFAHPRHCANLTPARLDQWRKEGSPLLLAPQIENPEQLARIAALARAYGINRVLIDKADASIAESGACYSAAKGALESVRFVTWEGRLSSLLKPLSERFLVVGLGGSGASRPNPSKPLSAPGRPLAIIASHPAHGLSNELIPHCEYRIQLPSQHPEFLTHAEALAPILQWLLGKAPKTPNKQSGFLARQKEKKQKPDQA